MGAIVQSTSAFNGAAGTTLGVTTGAAVVSGRMMWVVVTSDPTTATVADTLGNTYTQRGTTTETGVNQQVWHFTAPITAGGTPTVTVTFGASVAQRQIVVVEISGVSAYDAQGTSDTSSGGGVNPTPTATATNTAQPAFAIAACHDFQGPALAAGTGYTAGAGPFADWQTGVTLVQYKAVTNIGAQTTNFANSGADRNCTMFAIFTDTPTLPVINSQPASVRTASGNLATFSVTATASAGSLTYQWKKNGATISGATSASYSLVTSVGDQGALFTVDVTDSNGTVTSNAALLTLTFTKYSLRIKRVAETEDRTPGGWFETPMAGPGALFDQFMALPRVAGGTTGTLARTNANDTSSGVGTTTITGSVTRTNNNDTSSASGTTTIIATLSRTNNNDTSVGSGSVGASVTGTLSYTNNNDTSTGSATTTIVATLSRANASDTSTGTGSPIVPGSLARTNNNDTSVATGTTTLVAFLSYTNNNDTSVGSGTVGSAAAGTLAYTNINDNGVGSGFTTIIGILNKTNNNDTLAANGSSGSSGGGVSTYISLTSAGT